MNKRTSQEEGKQNNPLQTPFAPTVENCKKILEIVNEKIEDQEAILESLTDEMENPPEPIHNYGTHIGDAGTDCTSKECSGAQRFRTKNNVTELKDVKTRLERTIEIISNNGKVSETKQGLLPFTGMCRACEKSLPLARLLAVPTANTCVKQPCCVKK